MIKITGSDAPISNRILAALPAGEYQSLFTKLEQISLVYGEKIYERGEIIQFVYFPESGIISLLAGVEDSATLEVGIVGREGIVGLPVFLGVEISNNDAIVQGQGSALRIKSGDFLAECRNGGELPKILNRFTHSLLTQISQSAVCYRFHAIEERLARWLLMTSDRMETGEFPVTQEFLSNMLGVRREAVNKSAVRLQQKNLITYSRGNVSITNRRGLEMKSCRCYAVIKAEAESFPLN